MTARRKDTTRKPGYRLLVMIAAPLLALASGSVGWASVANPGPTNFVEIDDPANVGFDGIPGATFDWADSGANATPRNCTETPLMGGSCTSRPTRKTKPARR